MPLSNAEKQARFRKKEDLRKLVERSFREWQVMGIHSHANPRDVLSLFNDAASLPSGWTDEDYERAEHRIDQLRLDLVTSENHVKHDIQAARNSTEEFRKTPDPEKWIAETEDAASNAHALASHLISALELSRLGNEECAAAVMEAVRHVGRALMSSPAIGQSEATAVCLTTLPGNYDRPDWFISTLTKWLALRLGEDQTKELGHQLTEYNFESI